MKNNTMTIVSESTAIVDMKSKIVEVILPYLAALDPINVHKADEIPDDVSLAAELLAWDCAAQLQEVFNER